MLYIYIDAKVLKNATWRRKNQGINKRRCPKNGTPSLQFLL